MHQGRLKTWVFVLAFAALDPFNSYPIVAQELPCLPYPLCYRSRHFKTCGGATVKPLLTMRVTDISSDRCAQQLVKLKPENAAAHHLPEEIEIEFNVSCLRFAGKVGDTIQMALEEEHSLGTRRYSMACNPDIFE
jgi:hypothetical protein